MKKPLGNFLKSEIDDKYLAAKKKLLLIKTLGLVSVGLLSAAIANPKQPKYDLVGQLALSSVFALTAAYVSHENTDLFSQYETFVKMNREHKKNELSLNFGKAMMINEVANEVDLASRLQNLPVPAQLRYIEKYALQGLLTPVIDPPESIQANYSDVDRFVSLDSDLRDLERETNIDLSWIDSEFVNSSKVVVGGRGSGKSVYLRYEAARWLLEHPTGYLLLVDPHYDIREPKKHWLNDLDQKLVMKKFLSKHKDTRWPGEGDREWKGYLYHLRNVWVELQARIEGDDDSGTDYRPIKIIIDEIENIKRGCTESEFKEILKLIDCIQDEGRKYLVEITIGMHGLKKENTGIDSNTIAQMNWLLFEKACYDPVTKFPSDFDSREIKEVAKQISSNLDPRVGRTVVIIKQELSSPIITVLPLLTPPLISMSGSDSGEDEPPPTTTEQRSLRVEVPPESDSNEELKKSYMAMINWCKSCLEHYNKLPDREIISVAWSQLTGKELSEKALDYLIEKIFSDLEH